MTDLDALRNEVEREFPKWGSQHEAIAEFVQRKLRIAKTAHEETATMYHAALRLIQTTEADLASAREEIARLNVNEARLRAAAQALDGAIGPCSYDVGEKIMALRAALSASPSEALDVVRRAQRMLRDIYAPTDSQAIVNVERALARVFGEAGRKGGR